MYNFNIFDLFDIKINLSMRLNDDENYECENKRICWGNK